MAEQFFLVARGEGLGFRAGRSLHHGLYRSQGDRVRGVHEGDLALGTRAPAVARLRPV